VHQVGNQYIVIFQKFGYMYILNILNLTKIQMDIFKQKSLYSMECPLGFVLVIFYHIFLCIYFIFKEAVKL